MRKKGPTKTKNEGKEAYKGENEGNRPSKVPRAYESLNPGLGSGNAFTFLICKWHVKTQL
jgi:hypothetical protein